MIEPAVLPAYRACDSTKKGVLLKKIRGEMSMKQAERIIEEFENGSRNGEQWAHDVCLHRGTLKYEQCIVTLKEAFQILSIPRVICALESDPTAAIGRRRMRR
jgi:hypothetical protein